MTTVTGVSPEKPSARAPAGVRSMIRPRTNGPRSLIRTVTDLPLRRLIDFDSGPKRQCPMGRSQARRMDAFAVCGLVPPRTP